MQPNACAIRKVKEDMSKDGKRGDFYPPERQKGAPLLPPEILDIIKPALQVGGLSGASGFVVGGFAGVIRSSTPFLFALASGIQWFALGSTFWSSRQALLYSWRQQPLTSRDKVSASAIAGGISGTVGGILRGPRNVIPGAIVFALFGAAGQAIYNSADAKRSSQPTAPEDSKKSWMDSKWSPVRALSDKEYESMLREKLLRVNAEIALVDERINALREEEKVGGETWNEGGGKK